ncbi:MAG: RNase adapter RapZ [Wenzhouxiangellaceae bacterium]|nr:RNase adapter RapZ [Wenzhouxiangellaceae bacterium]
MSTDPERLLLISGLSGSGKSVALNALEDRGFYCVDNLPAALLPALAEQVRMRPERYSRMAIGVDARAGLDDLARLPERVEALDARFELWFLTAADEVLVRRFSETRRRHPLSEDRTLKQAIEYERRQLDPLLRRADQVIDTTATNVHELRRAIWELAGGESRTERLHLIVESFAFKRGVPGDVDLVFDARCLPNPHWQPQLRASTGLEREVREYLRGEAMVGRFLDDVDGFVRRWLPAWGGEQRSQLTVAIGCTGGRHRSVYLVDELASRWRAEGLHVVSHHRELER